MRIAIIGAGISGLYVAKGLAERNHQVIVYEKNKEPGDKVCSGLFSNNILDLVPESRSLIENRINYTLVHFPKKTVRIDFSREFLAMDHSKLDKIVCEKAKEEGVEIKFGSEINSPYFIKCPNTSGDFDKVIGCEGADSFTRKTLNLPSPKLRLGILGFVEKPCSDDFVEAWPCSKGFIWKIPRGKRIEYGIIAEPGKAKKTLDNFLQKKGIALKNLSAKTIAQGLIIPSEKNITLCGEAAGLTKPWTGGGVIWSLTAANFLFESFPDFLDYKARTESFFAWRITLGKIAEKMFRFLGFHLPWFLPKKLNLESDFLIIKRRGRGEQHSSK